MEKKNTDFKGYSGVRGVGFRHVVRCVYDCIFHLHVACNRLLHSQMYFIFGIYDSNYIHLSAKIIFLRFLLQLSNQKRIWFCNKVDVLHATIKNTIFFSIFFFHNCQYGLLWIYDWNNTTSPNPLSISFLWCTNYNKLCQNMKKKKLWKILST